MAVHGLLSALVQHDKEGIDPTIIENIWTLAERYGDVKTMVTIVSRPGDVPATVIDRARTRKEVDVRVAYLCRADLPGATRMDLLSNEKRAEVFAGLLLTASDNPELADRIVDQFRLKPTKVLARTLLRSGFTHDDVDFDCLKVLAGDRSMPDWLSRALARVASKYETDAAKGEILAEVLPLALLADANLTALTPSAQCKAITRLVAFASEDDDSRNWEKRYAISRASRNLLLLGAVEDLDPAVAELLDPVSTCDWFEHGEKLAGLLAGRKSAPAQVDDRLTDAKTATGARLTHLMQVSLTSGDVDNNVVLGLLENPRCWVLPQFPELVSHVAGALLVKAMHATRSDELMLHFWRSLNARLPEACWDHVTNRDELVRTLVNETVTQMVAEDNTNPYGILGSQLSFLLTRGVSNEVVAALPFSVLHTTNYSWRYNSMLEAVVPQLVALQMQYLGDDTQAWENFNNLAQDWSGTLVELLSASKSL